MSPYLLVTCKTQFHLREITPFSWVEVMYLKETCRFTIMHTVVPYLKFVCLLVFCF